MSLDKIKTQASEVTALPFETKAFPMYARKVAVLDKLLKGVKSLPKAKLYGLPEEVVDAIRTGSVGLTYSREYVRYEMKQSNPTEVALLKRREHYIGQTFLLLVRTVLDRRSDAQYLEALRTCKALIKYEEATIEDLDFEINTLLHRINNIER